MGGHLNPTCMIYLEMIDQDPKVTPIKHLYHARSRYQMVLYLLFGHMLVWRSISYRQDLISELLMPKLCQEVPSVLATSTTLKSYILGSVTLNSYIYHPTVKSELQGVILI